MTADLWSVLVLALVGLLAAAAAWLRADAAHRGVEDHTHIPPVIGMTPVAPNSQDDERQPSSESERH